MMLVLNALRIQIYNFVGFVKNPTDYLKKMRKRDEQLAFYLGTNCPQVEMKSLSEKKIAFSEKQVKRIRME